MCSRIHLRNSIFVRTSARTSIRTCISARAYTPPACVHTDARTLHICVHLSLYTKSLSPCTRDRNSPTLHDHFSHVDAFSCACLVQATMHACTLTCLWLSGSLPSCAMSAPSPSEQMRLLMGCLAFAHRLPTSPYAHMCVLPVIWPRMTK